MKVRETEIEGLKLIEPQVFGDARGWFVEQYNAERYKAAGIVADFVQDNESLSSQGVIRGLHWQAGEHAQAKLVRVIRGAVWDVAVDIRKGSPTYGRHVSAVLSAENRLRGRYALQLQVRQSLLSAGGPRHALQRSGPGDRMAGHRRAAQAV